MERLKELLLQKEEYYNNVDLSEDEYYQLRVSMVFSPDEENRGLAETLWSDDTDDNFFDYIRKSDGYDYAKNHKLMSIDIRIDQT